MPGKQSAGGLPSSAALGFSLMAAAQVVMPINDTIAKYLVMSFPVLQIAWARFFFNAVLLAPFALYQYRRKSARISQIRLHILRGVCLVLANLFFIMGVRYVPLADALTLVFITPLAVAALSPPVLGEKVDFWSWCIIFVGFAGILFVVRPGFNDVSLYNFLPLFAGTLFAIYLIVTRLMAGSQDPVLTQLTTSLVGAVSLSLLAPLNWTWPDPMTWVLMVTIGTLSALGHFMITKAHRHCNAAQLAPFIYLTIITATVTGFFVFGDWPTPFTFLGCFIVVFSGLLLWFKEHHLMRLRQKEQ